MPNIRFKASKLKYEYLFADTYPLSYLLIIQLGLLDNLHFQPFYEPSALLVASL